MASSSKMAELRADGVGILIMFPITEERFAFVLA